MLLPALVAFFVLLAPVAYVAWRKLSVVEQAIVFDAPQGGVTAVNLVIQDDTVQVLRILYEDGEICEVVPRSAEMPRARSTRGEASASGADHKAFMQRYQSVYS